MAFELVCKEVANPRLTMTPTRLCIKYNKTIKKEELDMITDKAKAYYTMYKATGCDRSIRGVFTRLASNDSIFAFRADGPYREAFKEMRRKYEGESNE